MQVHNNLEELLEDFLQKLHNRQKARVKTLTSWFVKQYASSNSLVSGKQRPLAKKKQMQEYFCLNKAYGFEHSLCLKTQCDKCKKLGKEIRADATSR